MTARRAKEVVQRYGCTMLWETEKKMIPGTRHLRNNANIAR
jgi:hypothetical protein